MPCRISMAIKEVIVFKTKEMCLFLMENIGRHVFHNDFYIFIVKYKKLNINIINKKWIH